MAKESTAPPVAAPRRVVVALLALLLALGSALSMPRAALADTPAVSQVCVSSRGFEQKEHRKLSSLSIGSAHAF